jgi:Arc/MetJ-type ribon-helix-helix transcriptional regulator
MVDITSVSCGHETRDRLKEYRDANGYQNYDEALRNLLQRVEDNE